MKSCILFVFSLSFIATASAQTMLFDFGNSARQTEDSGWNNVVYENPNPVPPLLIVVDDKGDVVPGVTFEMVDQLFINGQPSQAGTENPSGDAAAYPVDATDDYFFGHTGPFAGGEDSSTGGFKLTGLDPSTPYDFTFMSSRTGVNDSRETAYTVTGANSGSGVLEASNNDSEVLRINGITPDAQNEIYVEVSAGPGNTNGNKFFYINLMEVNWTVEPEDDLLLLISGPLATLRNRN